MNSTEALNAAHEREAALLAPHAGFSKLSQRRNPQDEDYRSAYKQDVDALLNSKAFARYADKTQVVYLVSNDHISHRNLHVQLVSSLARGIAALLGLNQELVEAIALGHDVGHPPFGHEGEMLLSELSQESGNGAFAHPVQSCRLLSVIEPLNLSLAVYDGMLCHDGGSRTHRITPALTKTWGDHEAEIERKREDPESDLTPMTFEGALVKLCDTVSYLSRDLEDAILLGILKRDEVPETLLGNTGQSIMTRFSQDVITHSDGASIGMSDEVAEALLHLREFNFKKIYFHPSIKTQSVKVRRSYRTLFTFLLEDFRKQNQESAIWRSFLANKQSKYLSTTGEVQMVVDYIAGMTDGFFIQAMNKFFIPEKISLGWPD